MSGLDPTSNDTTAVDSAQDQQGQESLLLDAETPKSGSDTTQQTQEQVVTEKPKKGLNGIVKFLLFILVLFMICGAGAAYYLIEMKQQPIRGLGQFGVQQPQTAQPVPVETVAQTPQPTQPAPQSSVFKTDSKPTEPPIFKSDIAASQPVVEAEPESPFRDSPKLNMPSLNHFKNQNEAIEQPNIVETEPVASVEPQAQSQMEKLLDQQKVNSPSNLGSEFDVAGGAYDGEQGSLSVGGYEDKVDSALDELASMRAVMDSYESRFANFDQSATLLHKKHTENIDHISKTQLQMNSSLIKLRSQMKTLETRLKDGVESKEVKQAIADVKKATKQVDSLVSQASQNDKNIKWMSRERLCLIEKSLGITKYGRQCSDFNKKHGTKAPLAISNVNRTPKPVQAPANMVPLYNSNPDVPATIGAAPVPAATANANMLATARPTNPCQFADRTWKLQLISGENAMLVRATDGFETIVEPHSNIPGLGRAQAFNASGYPNYVQFTNGIVCGG